MFLRWFRSFNISHASEGKQRKVAKKWTGEDLLIEMTPFRFEDRERKKSL